MSTAIERRPYWLPQPDSMAEAVRMAEYLCRSELVPERYRDKPADVLLAADYAHRVGLPLFSGLRAVYMVKGTAGITSEGMLAVCAGRPDFRDISETVSGNGDAMVATCTVTRGDRTPVTRTFSMQDAQRAELRGNAMYRKYPQRMLAMRARSFALRDCYADALAGCGASAEEIADVYDVNDPAAWVEHADKPAAAVHQGPPPAAEAEPPRRRGRPPTGRPRGRPRKQPVVVEAAIPTPSAPLPGQRPLPEDMAPGGQPPGWAERIASARTGDELVEVGRQVAAAQLPDAEQARLREAYGLRQRQLLPPMPGPTSAPTAWMGATAPTDEDGMAALRRRAAERGA